MTDFIPTHKTVNAIRYIESGTPIKVVRYTDGAMWSVIKDLGFGDDNEIGVRYLGSGDAEIHFDGEVLPVFRNDYVITDGETFAAVSNDTGWVPYVEHSSTGTDSTVGKLCADDLYSTEIELGYRNSTVRGTLTALEFAEFTWTLGGPVIRVFLTAGGISVGDLPRDTPCRIFRTHTA